jgi:hypothetical protein
MVIQMHYLDWTCLHDIFQWMASIIFEASSSASTKRRIHGGNELSCQLM